MKRKEESNFLCVLLEFQRSIFLGLLGAPLLMIDAWCVDLGGKSIEDFPGIFDGDLDLITKLTTILY